MVNRLEVSDPLASVTATWPELVDVRSVLNNSRPEICSTVADLITESIAVPEKDCTNYCSSQDKGRRIRFRIFSSIT